MVSPLVTTLIVLAFLLVFLSSSPGQSFTPNQNPASPGEAAPGSLKSSVEKPVSTEIVENPAEQDKLESLDEPDNRNEAESRDMLNNQAEPEEPTGHNNPDEPEVPEIPPEETVLNINDANPGLAGLLDNIALQYNCAAVSLVAYDGDLRDYYTYQYGFRSISAGQPVDRDTKLRVASLSKLVVVICAMTLVESGALVLDADISDYIGYTVRNPHFPDIAITPRMLMQHTSSIYDSDIYKTTRNKDLPETTRRLLDAGTCYEEWKPGSHFDYSNFGYAILGLICEKISGKRFDTLARDILFDPIDIDASFLPARLSDTGNIAVIYDENHRQTRSVQSQLNTGDSSSQGSDHNQITGNLTMSMIDYAKILTMLGNGGTFGDVRILSGESINEMHNANAEGEGFKQGLASRYQNDTSIPGAGSYWHTGSSWGTFAQYMYIIGDGGNRGVVVVTTGATTGRLDNGMVDLCTELSVLVWELFE